MIAPKRAVDKARFLFLFWVISTLLTCGYAALAQSGIATQISLTIFYLGIPSIIMYEIYVELQHQFRNSGAISFRKWIKKSFIGWFYRVCWTIGVCSLAVGIIAAGFVIYHFSDVSGFIEHEHDTPVWIQGKWLPHEYRVCVMPGNLWGNLPGSAHLLCGSGDAEAIDGIWPSGFRYSLSQEEAVQLQDGHWDGLERYFHVLPVQYWGRIDRTDQAGFSWECQRRSAGLVCKALN